MKPRWIFSDRAKREFLTILDYLAEDNEHTALRIKQAIYEALTMLAKMPEIGHSRTDLTNKPFKFWSVYSYLIVYDPSTKPLGIVAIIHGARDVERLLK